ncbi:hypothetical protein AKJ39_03205 [candidate division MSBL1 archaeon SCGC-AAA259J03]|uniref:Tyr recombinase domain-containing protein n=1 Tax=candidate division MSBL1 archaeon SCGC-AAA259J03 TaxID=1698269 RepID=A0A656YVP7_9EURY|nr:hypothetical protein AKJ39_03205 [candidate division MSBL1 archaeon SCGC-AAA259J03]
MQFLRENNITAVGREDIRQYLKAKREGDADSTYANRIKALRRFFRDFLEAEELIGSFELPRTPSESGALEIPDKGDLQKFFDNIDMSKYRAIFLFKATSGLRTSEVASLKMDNINFEKRMVVPNHDGNTKRSYVTFYNRETERELEEFLPERRSGDERLFQTTVRPIQKAFQRASDESGIKISPKTLRKWFAKEMRNLNVSGEHIDAFCGRLPSSIRAKHYTDLSPERLREVYEEADITVLS